MYSHELEAGETVLVAKGVHLADCRDGGRTRPLIAVGTSFSAGEPRSPLDPIPFQPLSNSHDTGHTRSPECSPVSSFSLRVSLWCRRPRAAVRRSAAFKRIPPVVFLESST